MFKLKKNPNKLLYFWKLLSQKLLPNFYDRNFDLTFTYQYTSLPYKYFRKRFGKKYPQLVE